MSISVLLGFFGAVLLVYVARGIGREMRQEPRWPSEAAAQDNDDIDSWATSF